MVKRSLPRSGAYDLTRFVCIIILYFAINIIHFSYMPVFLWKEQMKREGKDAFKELLRILSKRQNEDEEDTNDTAAQGQVCVNCRIRCM